MKSIKRISMALVSILIFSMGTFSQSNAKGESVRSLIAELRARPWQGPYAAAIPLQWDFQFTEPMQKILEIGTPAQDALIENIDDPAIKDQVIILLGGLGDECAISPIINAMADEKHLKSTPNAERINLSADLALTNITVTDVIWHYGGGIAATLPPEDSKNRWMQWWKKNKGTFTVKGITHGRSYSNYPNYGVYRQAN